jgi:hypothetical protein
VVDLTKLRSEQFHRDYKFDFMQAFDPEGPIPKTDGYVCSPPALWVRDSDGSVFTLGTEHIPGHQFPTGEYEYDVVWNGIKTGEFACRIEMRGGRIRIYGIQGWRTWSQPAKRFI